MTTRIRYLDGLRGILAVIVFIHHFLYAFYPWLVFGGEVESYRTGNWTVSRLFALTPLNIVFNPGTAINFFFLLSGYVQTVHYFEKQELYAVQRNILKRYFRLAIPTLAVVLLVYAFHRLNWIDRKHFPPNPLTWDWIQSMLPDNLNFWETLRYGLLDCFNSKTQSYQVLWTMPVELYNSWMVLIALMVTHRIRNKLPLYIFWFLVQFILLEGYYAMSFTLGLILACLHTQQSRFASVLLRPSLKYVCLIVGLYFASFPFTGYENSSRESIYAPIAFFDRVPHVISYAFGNFLLFCFLLHAPRLQNALSQKIFLFFGDISFMFYLLHFLILFSFSPWLFFRLFPSFHDSISNYLITFVCSFTLITLLSWLLYKLVDQPVIRLCNRWSRMLLKEERF